MPYSGIDEVKQNNSIFDVVRSYGLKVNAKGFVVCPFHNDKNGSMKLYKNNTYYCFGCSCSGDVITFVRQIENVDFKTAYFKLGGIDKMLTPEEKRQYAREKAARERRQKEIDAIKKNIFAFECVQATTEREIFALPDHPEEWDGGFWGKLQKLDERRLKCEIRLSKLRMILERKERTLSL